MDSSINLIAIYIANTIGLVLMIVEGYSNRWRLKHSTKESGPVLWLMIITAISCIVDPFCFAMDGRPGAFAFIMVFLGNGWLYFTNLLIMPFWTYFLIHHLQLKQPKKYNIILRVIILVGALLLIINAFYPIVYSVDDNNVYHRHGFYWFYVVCESFMLLNTLMLYFSCRKKSGKLKFFPIWIFILPAAIGMTIQSVYYGVSTIWPFFAISIVGLLANMQNEVIYRDQLTGLYNRFYLDEIKKQLTSKFHKKDYTAMMLDLNRFKRINDEYGHHVGDLALIQTAEILRVCVDEKGSIIRYAGDEFIIILKTVEKEEIQSIIQNIHQKLQEFSDNSPTFKLSVSIGYCLFDTNSYTPDDMMNQIDKLMYIEKEKAHEQEAQEEEMLYNASLKNE